ncbi:MAG: stage III sporulation protein AF [Defluviitaleaceae bacterium]|nr:stage III sporulation protein AF [Defluviitaleaceae bacterium]MCL2274632.1 stage III sporulation protein AF [Defluviitaleaceae bacterium]
MVAFFSYLSNITYYLLFAGVANMLAPAGKYRKLVALVTGLVLVVIIIAPVRNIGQQFNAPDFFASMANAPAMQGGEATGLYYTTNTVLAAAFSEQLSFQLEGMLERNGFKLHQASLTHTDDFAQITGIWAEVSRVEETRRVPFIRIEPVQVNRNAVADEADPLVREVKNLISDFYNLSHAHIHVIIQKR